ncbi:MAG: SdrD B-like domain-containing protein [Ilumatobacter sp.]
MSGSVFTVSAIATNNDDAVDPLIASAIGVGQGEEPAGDEPVTDAAVSTDPPVTTDAPPSTDAPPATNAPVDDGSVVTDPPVSTDAPPATDAPPSTDAPTTTAEPADTTTTTPVDPTTTIPVDPTTTVPVDPTTTVPVDPTTTVPASSTTVPASTSTTEPASSTSTTTTTEAPTLVCLGGRVWIDVDGDGAFDSEDSGIPNVAIRLTSSPSDGPEIVVNTSTNSQGVWSADDLPAGFWTVTVTGGVPAGLDGDVDPDSASNSDGTAIVNVGADDKDLDFTYRPTGRIGDRVYEDRNDNGVFDAGDVGIGGVTLQITDLGPDGVRGGGDDRIVARPFTNSDGSYLVTNLPDGTYAVDIFDGAPADFELTVDPQGTNSPDGLSTTTIAGGSSDLTQDFGYQPTDAPVLTPLEIEVYIDTNGDGDRDDGEPAVPNQPVTVTLPGPDGVLGTDDDVTDNYTTDDNGQVTTDPYPSVPVQVIINGGIADTSTNSDDPDGGTPDESFVTIVPGSTPTQVFGYTDVAPTGDNSLGDTIFNDVDRDGIDDGAGDEPRLEGVEVTVTFLGADNAIGGGDDVVIGVFTTDENGRYEATNLPDGRFLVEVTGGVPVGFDNTVDPQGTASPDERSTVTLNGGQTNNDQDFGYAAPIVPADGSIGDQIYFDTDGDGVQDDPADEPGISNVTVTLTSAGDDGIFGTADDRTSTTTTDGNGNYSFDGLAPGDYRVDVETSTLPAGLINTDDLDDDNDSSAPVTLGDDEDRTDVDFGYTAPAAELGSIGDRVFFDTNGDGTQDDPADEPGIAGVTVVLTTPGPDGVLGTGDDVDVTDTTDADGRYLFEDLPAGDYTVTVVGSVTDELDNTVDPDGPTPAGDSTSSVTLGAGDDIRDQDFGYEPAPQTFLVGDRVWYDLDRDGVQDAGEPGINGVTVTLTLPGGSTQTDITSGNGDYLFTVPAAGEYTLTVTAGLPGGVVATFDADSGINAPDGTSTVDLTDSNLLQDFGYVGTGRIGDMISLIVNGEEVGVPGVGVTVTFAGPDGVLGTGDDIVFPTSTDDDGKYLVTNLPAGEYRIDIDEDTLPDGVSPVDDPDGGDDSTSTTTLGAGETDLDQDFSYTGTGRIGDTVYLDTNGDGDQDDPADEPGIPGVTVRLTGENTGIVLTTQTGDDGDYLFDGLPADTYTVEVIGGLPNGVDNTDDPDSPIGAGDSTSVVTLPAGGEDLDQDFGYQAESLLGDRVWLDLDRDGVQDAGEPGINGVTVTATDDDGNEFTAVTAGDGDYLFTGLTDGEYTVTVTAGVPAGLEATFDADSGVTNPDETSTTDLVTSDLDQDFGYVGTGSIGDTVFADDNADGVQNTGEDGIPGIPVTVTGAGQDGIFGTGDDIVVETVTDDDGEYLVDGLPDGDYTVEIDPTQAPGDLTVVSDPASDDGTVDPDGIAELTLAPGENNEDQDFGLAALGSIGDTVYLDTNGDGEQGDPADEPGIGGVTVTLEDEDGNITETETDEDGTYLFDNLPAGEYTVTVTGGLPDSVANTDDPDGPSPAGDSTSTLTLAPGEDNEDQDFGYDALSVLGDRVWFDANRDGVQDPGEPGINGVTVTATDENDNVFTTVTEGDGDYLFTDIPDGVYVVTVTDGVPAGFGPTFDADSPADGTTSAGDETSTTDLVTEDLDQDFGYAGVGSISGTVIFDRDGSNGQNGDEPGLEGVTVTVTSAGPDGVFGTPDDIVFETETDENGDYSVGGLPDGDYIVDVDETTVPAGLSITFDTDGNDDGTTPVTLTGGEDREDVDFGYNGDGVIGDTVYFDVNGNGTQDPGEPGVVGQQVELTWPGEDGVLGTPDDQTFTTTTGDDGAYTFTGLPDGEYAVTVVDGITNSANNTDDPDDGAPNTSTTTLGVAEGREDLDQDFGYQGINRLGDTVWLDENGDGVDDGAGDEERLEGVDVIVTWAGPDDVLGTDDDVTYPAATTDENGEYIVEGLPDGTFKVTVDETTLPDGVNNTVDAGDADDPGAPVDGMSETTLRATTDGGVVTGDEDLDQDFGYVSGASISGTIVLDSNGDGDEDDGEPGLPGVRIVLLDDEGNEIAETVTDENGDYTFPGLDAGDYVVDVDETTLPDGVEITFDDDGDDDGTMPVTLEENENREDVDAGYVGVGTIGDTIYFDNNGNGTQDGDEPGVPGQTVTLLGAGADDVFGTADDFEDETVTDDNGQYLFDGLPAGDYIVTVGSPENPGIAAAAENTGDPDDGEPNTSATTLDEANGFADFDQDFGYQGVNSLGDTVFFDANRDGIDGDDADEPGIAGVDVIVTWAGPDDVFGTADDVVYPAATTNDQGEYLVDGLPDGTFEVAVDETTLPDGLANTVDNGDVVAGDSTAPIDGVSETTLQATVAGGVIVGDEDLDQDFGYVSGASISGTIVLDADGNGVEDPGEPGIPGVRIVLLDDEGNEVAETTTDENGDYTFPGLDAGDYVVDVDETTLPDGVEITFDDDGDDDGTMPVTLEENENREDVDAGYTGNGTIGDTIYLDLNGNGVQDSLDGLEPGVPGQTVTLTGEGADGVLGTDDDVILETTTDENGEYLFEGLPDGDYIVTVVGGIADVADNTGDPDDGTPNTSTTSLGDDNDREDLDQDFGYQGPNRLGDTVFLDENGNGVDDGAADEDRLEGIDITVTWYGPDGVPGGGDDVILPNVTTDENGEYIVDGLPDGTFEVDVDETTVPAGLDPTVDVGDAGTPAEGSIPNGISEVTLTSTNGVGDENLDQDFGYIGGGSISGTIVFDQDRDGVEDPDETGLEGIRIVLLDDDGNEVAETTTDENGDYTFVGLDAGDYVVDVDESTLPDGVTITFDDDDGTTDPDGTMPVTLGTTPGGDVEDITDVDAGYAGENTIGDTIYFDINGNGTQDDGEPGIPGQTVTLTGPDGIADEAITDENGRYLFEGLPDGDYTVTVVGGIVDAAENTGDPDDGTPNTSDVTVGGDAGNENLDQDFGYRGPNSLGDTIFFDENADGIDGDDATEPGVPGVDVIVTWYGPDGVAGGGDDVTFPAATTDDTGFYQVAGLPDGTFDVSVDETTLPSGYQSTVDTADEAGDPIDGHSEVTLTSVLGDGEENNDVDFGYVSGGSIAGTVILDVDGNEAQNGDEPGLAGIRIVLLDDEGNEIRETTTDVNGDYSFPGLPAGTFTVVVDETTLPDGVTATFDTDGGDDGITQVTLNEDPVTGDVDNVEDVDFGYNGPGEIGGIIFIDTDGDGVQDPDEPGVPGQPVTITWAGPDGELGTDDDVDFPTTTGDDGSYSVDGLPDGDYKITVGPEGIPSAANNTADPDGPLDSMSFVTLDPETGRTQTDQDFGYQGDNGVGDTVYVDANGNGVDDGAATDPRVPGATVTITWDGVDGIPGTDDDVVFTEVTNDDGIYGAAGLPDGTYTITLDPTTLPPGTAPAVDPDGGAPDGVSVIELADGTVNEDQDFGVGGGASIGDTVWLDLDGDGVRDLGEPGLTGATVTATYLGPDGEPGGGDDVVYTTTVDESGNYLFEDLPAGVYDIVISGLPAGVSSSFDPDGVNDGATRITLGLDETNLDQDFGFVGTAAVGDDVFIDADGDGIRDVGEPGLPGVTVTVTSAGVDGVLGTDDDIVVTAVTDDNGNYFVPGLPTGPTTITYDPAGLPAGVVPLGDLDGGSPTSTTVTLEPNDIRRDIDFPAGGDASLDGTVFNDADGDGVRDPGETTVPGATVIVTTQGPDGPIEIRVVTDDNGGWSVDNLPPGTYTVTVDPTTLPDGVVPSTGLPISVVLDVGDEKTVDIPVIETVNAGGGGGGGGTGGGTGGDPTPRPIPRTGSDGVAQMLSIAIALLMAGLALVVIRRRPTNAS